MNRSQMIKMLQSSAAVLSSLEQSPPSPNSASDTAGAQAKVNVLQLILQILEGILAQEPVAGQSAADLQQENIGLFNAVTDILSAIHIENAKGTTAPAVDIGGVQINILQLIVQIIQAVLASSTFAAPTTASAAKPCPCQKAPASGLAHEEAIIRPLVTSDSVAYGYDSLGRLHTLTFANGTVVTYNYDSVGNRTSVVTACSGGGC